MNIYMNCEKIFVHNINEHYCFCWEKMKENKNTAVCKVNKKQKKLSSSCTFAGKIDKMISQNSCIHVVLKKRMGEQLPTFELCRIYTLTLLNTHAFSYPCVLQMVDVTQEN